MNRADTNMKNMISGGSDEGKKFNEAMEEYLQMNFYNIDQTHPEQDKEVIIDTGIKVTSGFMLRSLILGGNIKLLEEELDENEVGGYYEVDPDFIKRKALVQYLWCGINGKPPEKMEE